MPHQSFFISKLVFFDSLLLMICYTAIQVSARLERRYPVASLLPIISNEPEAIFTVTISGTNSAITALTNAFTVTIGGAITPSESGSLPFSTSTSASPSLTSDNIKATQTASTVTGTTTSQTTGTTTLSTSQATHPTTAIIQTTSTTPAETITTSSSSPSFVVSQNLQTFTGALGNISAPQVLNIGNGQFSVEGNSVFNSEKNALSRSCAVQHNDCGDAANADHDGSFTVNDCDTQEAQCNSVAGGS